MMDLESVKAMLAAKEAATGMDATACAVGGISLVGVGVGVAQWLSTDAEQRDPAGLIDSRWVAGGLGGVALAAGIAKRGVGGALLGAIGAGLLLKALTNARVTDLLGFGAREAGQAIQGQEITVDGSVTIPAPDSEVFKLWSRYENFPRFMSYVREVRDLGGRRSHWVIEGPLGVNLEWDAVMTQYQPNRVIAWQSEPNAAVENHGQIHFEPRGNDQTAVHVKFSYRPPLGRVGHALAKLLGDDPKTKMQEDLNNMAEWFEQHDGSAAALGVTTKRRA